MNVGVFGVILLLAAFSSSSSTRRRFGRECRVLRVGVVFTEEDVEAGRPEAFGTAVDLINERSKEQKGFFPSHEAENFCVSFESVKVSNKSGSFRLSKELCRGLENENGGYHVVVGPADLELAFHVKSICDALDVPHISVSVDNANAFQSDFSINFYPRIEDIHGAVASFLSYLSEEPTTNESAIATTPSPSFDSLATSHAPFEGVKLVAVVFSSGRGASALKLQDALLSNGIDCIVRGINKDNGAYITRELKQRDVNTVLMEIGSKKELAQFFSSCRQVGFFGEDRRFVLVSLNFNDFEADDEDEDVLKSFIFFRLVDPKHPIARVVSKRLRLKLSKRIKRDEELAVTDSTNFDKDNAKDSKIKPVGFSDSAGPTYEDLELETCIVYDALTALLATSEALNDDFIDLADSNGVSCGLERPWPKGSTFFNFLNSVRVEDGVTGKIAFKEGYRSSLELDLMRYSAVSKSVRKIGHFKTDRRETDNIDLSKGLSIPNRGLLLENDTESVTLMVVTKQERPYVMLRKGREGNDAYDGFAIDLLKAISDVLGFKFKLYTVPDNLYGYYNHETGEWNGIVRELIDKRADLAVASMTINYARENVIDFTKPFMNLGISILFKAPEDPATELFSFMNPLALEIWLYILFAYILVSMTIWIVARFSPYEWAHPSPCSSETGAGLGGVAARLVFQNDFTLPNSFWFAIGTLMQQGSDLNPKAVSTRIVGGIWWFFTLIMISSYTANLAAFLTVERMATPIESADDLADQKDISYGTLVGGSTMTFFRDSKIETYAKMWRYMESKEPGTFVDSYERGVERVLDGDFAFLCESTMLDYLVQRNCNLTQIGGLLDNKGYGIATPKGSKWKDRISQAILFLQEKGMIQMYYDKWWKSHGQSDSGIGDGGCERNKKTLDQKAMANALGIVNIGGIFVVLLCGLAFAVMVAICEFCWSTRTSNKRQEPTSLCNDLVASMTQHVYGKSEVDDDSTPPQQRDAL